MAREGTSRASGTLGVAVVLLAMVAATHAEAATHVAWYDSV